MLLSDFEIFNGDLSDLPDATLLISTINAHSFNVAKKDTHFMNALQRSDVLIPDGISIVLAKKILYGQKIRKIAGDDLFKYEMGRLQAREGGSCFFLGSSESVLSMIAEKANREYSDVKIGTYSPPYKAEFTLEETNHMIDVVNGFQPDVLFVGMTAPKQEKWAYDNKLKLNVGHICCIGAVFDFYAGTMNRAPGWMIAIGMEWCYRLFKEPKRMWRRYLIGNVKFLYFVIHEKLRSR